MFIFAFCQGKLVNKSSLIQRLLSNYIVAFDGSTSQVGFNLEVPYQQISLLPTTTVGQNIISNDPLSNYVVVPVATTENFLLAYQYLQAGALHTVNVNFNFVPASGTSGGGYPDLNETITLGFSQPEQPAATNVDYPVLPISNFTITSTVPNKGFSNNSISWKNNYAGNVRVRIMYGINYKFTYVSQIPYDVSTTYATRIYAKTAIRGYVEVGDRRESWLVINSIPKYGSLSSEAEVVIGSGAEIALEQLVANAANIDHPDSSTFSSTGSLYITITQFDA